MMHNPPEIKKTIKQVSELPLTVPSFLFSSDFKELNNKPQEGISKLYRNCSNVNQRMEITFNGKSVPDECFAVDEYNHKKIPGEDQILEGTVENFAKFKQFFTECLSEKGFELLIKMYDQSNLGGYQFFLQQVAKKHNLVFSNAKSTRANYFYDGEKQTLVVEVIIAGLQLKQLSDPEKTSELFANTIIGTRLIKHSSGMSTVFLTDNPTILIELFKLYVDHHFVKFNSQGFFKFKWSTNQKFYDFLFDTVSKHQQQFAEILQQFNNEEQLNTFIKYCISLQEDVLITSCPQSKLEQSNQLIQRIENVISVTDLQKINETKQLNGMIKDVSEKTALLVHSFQLHNLMQSAGLHTIIYTSDFIKRAKGRLTMFRPLTEEQDKFLKEKEKQKLRR